MKVLILSLFLFVQSIIHAQEISVNQIVESDTINFDLHEAGCFHSSSEKIVMIKQSANLYHLVYTNNVGKILKKDISKSDLIKFGQLFSVEKSKTHKCISTTSTEIVLTAKGKSNSFHYSGCKEKSTPMQILKRSLHL